MSLLDVIKGLLGIVPSAIEAGKQVADAVKPHAEINENNAVLWHTTTRRLNSTGAYQWCTVCQRTIPTGFANTLCSEAVRRRNAGIA